MMCTRFAAEDVAAIVGVELDGLLRHHSGRESGRYAAKNSSGCCTCRHLSAAAIAAYEDRNLMVIDNLVAKSSAVRGPFSAAQTVRRIPRPKSFRNMRWGLDQVFDYLKFPILMKPAYGGGWKDATSATTPEEFFAAYDQTRMNDDGIGVRIELRYTYYRCYVLSAK